MTKVPKPLDYAPQSSTRRRALPLLSGLAILASGLVALPCVRLSYGDTYFLNELGGATAAALLCAAAVGAAGGLRGEPAAAWIGAVFSNVAVLVLWLSIGGQSYFGGSP